jgi:hypothetical protein
LFFLQTRYKANWDTTEAFSIKIYEIPPELGISPYSSLLHVEEHDLAEQLTIIDMEMLKRITPMYVRTKFFLCISQE